MAVNACIPSITLSLRPEYTLFLASVSMAETACVPLLTLLALFPEFFAQSWLLVLLLRLLVVVLFFFFRFFLHDDAHDAMNVLRSGLSQVEGGKCISPCVKQACKPANDVQSRVGGCTADILSTAAELLEAIVIIID